MASIWEKAISILAGNLNLGHSYLITAVTECYSLKGKIQKKVFKYNLFRRFFDCSKYYTLVEPVDSVINLLFRCLKKCNKTVLTIWIFPFLSAFTLKQICRKYKSGLIKNNKISCLLFTEYWKTAKIQKHFLFISLIKH